MVDVTDKSQLSQRFNKDAARARANSRNSFHGPVCEIFWPTQQSSRRLPARKTAQPGGGPGPPPLAAGSNPPPSDTTRAAPPCGHAHAIVPGPTVVSSRCSSTPAPARRAYRSLNTGVVCSHRRPARRRCLPVNLLIPWAPARRDTAGGADNCRNPPAPCAPSSCRWPHRTPFAAAPGPSDRPRLRPSVSSWAKSSIVSLAGSVSAARCLGPPRD